jgi:sugar fermentation stimulation protein A
LSDFIRRLPSSGTYALTVPFAVDESMLVGSLGTLPFKRGFYVYVGSARPNLRQRIARHVVGRKRIRWHIDYITTRQGHGPVGVAVWRSASECSVASMLKKRSNGSVRGFGSSDCCCGSHLIYFATSGLLAEAISTASPDVVLLLR